MVAFYVVHWYARETMTNQTPRILYNEPPRIRWQMGLYFDHKQQNSIQWWQRWQTQFGGGEEDNTMPRDGWLQQYNASTPQKRGTRRRKIRDEEEQIAHPLKHGQSTKHPEGNTTTEKGSLFYRNFPKSWQRNIHPTDSDSHANAGL